MNAFNDLPLCSESAHQQRLFAFCAVARRHGFEAAKVWAQTGIIVPSEENAATALAWLHAISNGGLRSKATGARLKAEGVRAGVADIFLPVARHGFFGLYIELKYKSSLSLKQIEFRDFVVNEGYSYICAKSWREAAEFIEKYLK